MTIQIDSREHAHAIEGIKSAFIRAAVKFYVSKLYVGDYCSLDNPRLVIDRKQNLSEVCSNLTQQHERFRAECIRAREAGIKLIILVETNGGIKSLDDVEKWVSPRAKREPSTLQGAKLAKTMRTMAERYGIEWRFCDRRDTGREIVRLLEVT